VHCVDEHSEVILEILYIWLPACLALVSVVWIGMLSWWANGSWRLAVHVPVALFVLYLSVWSVWALFGIRFLDWWPTYLPYIFVAAGLAISGAWHLVLRRG
jgi:membrane protein YdbS with pleckstrin-like domain